MDSLAIELLHHIAFFAATSSSSHPPSVLLPLLTTCRAWHASLNAADHPHLYARIFRATFDSSALYRRLPHASLSANLLHTELVRRWCVLKRIRWMAGRWTGSTDWSPRRYRREAVLQDLMTIYLMLMEDDGRNAAILNGYADLRTWLTRYRTLRLVNQHYETTMPEDAEETALFWWVEWLSTDYREWHAYNAQFICGCDCVLNETAFIHREVLGGARRRPGSDELAPDAVRSWDVQGTVQFASSPYPSYLTSFSVVLSIRSRTPHGHIINFHSPPRQAAYPHHPPMHSPRGRPSTPPPRPSPLCTSPIIPQPHDLPPRPSQTTWGVHFPSRLRFCTTPPFPSSSQGSRSKSEPARRSSTSPRIVEPGTVDDGTRIGSGWRNVGTQLRIEYESSTRSRRRRDGSTRQEASRENGMAGSPYVSPRAFSRLCVPRRKRSKEKRFLLILMFFSSSLASYTDHDFGQLRDAHDIIRRGPRTSFPAQRPRGRVHPPRRAVLADRRTPSPGRRAPVPIFFLVSHLQQHGIVIVILEEQRPDSGPPVERARALGLGGGGVGPKGLVRAGAEVDGGYRRQARFPRQGMVLRVRSKRPCFYSGSWSSPWSL